MLTLISRRDSLIGEIRRQRETLFGNRRLSFAEAAEAEIFGDRGDCQRSILVSFLAEQILAREMNADDFPWEQRHLDLLAHVAACPSCIALGLVNDDSPALDALVTEMIQRLAHDSRVPKGVRDILRRSLAN